MAAVRVESLSEASAAAASEIVREYMIVTEIERGNAAVLDHGLPDVLRQECDAVLERYAEPNHLLLAFADELVGCVGVKLHECDVEISRLYVREGFRQQRIGSRLMAAAEDYARSHGSRRIVLDVLPSRTRVIEWYRRMGFHDTTAFEDLPMPMVYLEKPL